MEEKLSLLKKEVEGLVKDFHTKRTQYKRKKEILQIVLICTGALTSLAIGLSFVEEITFACKIIGVILSTITTIITGIVSVYNYEQRWKQRSITYLRLLELKRDLKLENEISLEKYDKYKQRLNEIMNLDTELWLENMESQNAKSDE